MTLKRFAAVTAGLAAAGFAVGAGLSAVVAAVVIASVGGMRDLVEYGEYVLAAGLWGGGVGAVIGPAAAWLLMRHVPLWKAIGGTAAGTLAGIGLAFLVIELPFGETLVDGLRIYLYPLLGFGAAAIALRRSAARQASAGIAVSDGGSAPSLPPGSG